MTAAILPFPTASRRQSEEAPTAEAPALPRVILNGRIYTVIRNLADRAVVEGVDGFQRVTSLDGATFLH